MSNPSDSTADEPVVKDDNTSASIPDPSAVDCILQDIVKPFGIWQFLILMSSVWSDIPAAIFPIYGNSPPSKFHCQMESHIQDMLLLNQTNSTLIGYGFHKPKGPLEMSGNKYKIAFDTVAAAVGPWGNQTTTPGCQRYKRNYKNVQRLQELFRATKSTPVEACPLGYVYEADKYQYPSGIVIEWDLVCNREWLTTFSTSMYMLGMVPGFWIGGLASDSFGRRTTALAFWVLQVIAGIACSFAPSFTFYAILRFALGLTSVARSSALLILPAELTTAKYRFVVSSSICIVQNFISRALVTLAAYFIPYWRWLHLVTISPLALGIPQFWILPESPRWLISKKRWDEAANVLYRGYLINHRGWCDWRKRKVNELKLEDFTNYFSFDVDEEEEQEKDIPRKCFCYRLFDRLRQPYRTQALTKISLIGTFLFLAQAACLFGVLLYARTVRGYIYLVALINNLTAIPGAIISAVLYAKLHHRKQPLIVAHICASVCLALGGIYAAVTTSTDDIVLAVCSNLGLILCTSISNMILIYIPELFPSCIRSQGLGNAAGLGRLGATLGSYINSLDASLTHGIPLLVYSGMLILASLALLFLPDTTGENLEDSIAKVRRKVETSPC